MKKEADPLREQMIRLGLIEMSVPLPAIMVDGNGITHVEVERAAGNTFLLSYETDWVARLTGWDREMFVRLLGDLMIREMKGGLWTSVGSKSNLTADIKLFGERLELLKWAFVRADELFRAFH